MQAAPALPALLAHTAPAVILRAAFSQLAALGVPRAPTSPPLAPLAAASVLLAGLALAQAPPPQPALGPALLATTAWLAPPLPQKQPAQLAPTMPSLGRAAQQAACPAPAARMAARLA